MNGTHKFSRAETIITAIGHPNLPKGDRHQPGWGAIIRLFREDGTTYDTMEACASAAEGTTAHDACLFGVVAALEMVRELFNDLPVTIITNLASVTQVLEGGKRNPQYAPMWTLLDELLEGGEAAFQTRGAKAVPQLEVAKELVYRLHTHGPNAGMIVREVSAWRRYEAAA